jgi:hypothetical protein
MINLVRLALAIDKRCLALVKYVVAQDAYMFDESCQVLRFDVRVVGRTPHDSATSMRPEACIVMR